MGRAPCCEKSEVKRGPWSPEEDALLTDYINRSGTGGSWIGLPKKAGLKRCGKSCRLRWINYLRPGIKHGCYSEEEDGLIVRLYAELGSRWSVIASHLPGRTDNDVKNYWNTRLKKKLIAARGAAFLTPATTSAAAAAVPVYNYTTTSMDFSVHHQGSMDVVPQAYPEVGPDHWFYQLSNDQFALPRLSEALENRTPAAFDALFSASSSTTSSVARSYASWSYNMEEMESKSSVYYAGSLPSFFGN